MSSPSLKEKKVKGLTTCSEKISTNKAAKKPNLDKLSENNGLYYKLLKKYKSYSPNSAKPRASKTPVSQSLQVVEQKNDIQFKNKSLNFPKTVHNTNKNLLSKLKMQKKNSSGRTHETNDKKNKTLNFKKLKNNEISSSKENIINRKISSENNKNSQLIDSLQQNNSLKENKSQSKKELLTKNILLDNKVSPKSLESSEKKIVKSASVPNIIPKKKIVKKIYKIESLSQVGFSGLGIKKYNQDSFFIYKNLNDEKDVLYIGVCDGHGLEGHDVSRFLSVHLPQNLNTELKKTKKYIHDKSNLEKTLNEVFLSTNKSLCDTKTIDTQFSGSTCVTIILTKHKIISANAGDSRAVLGRFIDGKWVAIDLSRDHKPSDEDEKKRILAKGGRIEAYKDENGGDFGPKRVWLKDADVPGLAMSRSFGDRVAASVGTISEPEIKYFELTKDDKFVIIASDGIWEFITSQECVNIIKDYYLKKELTPCLKYLLTESSKRWIKEEEVIDDITAVIVFFEE